MRSRYCLTSSPLKKAPSVYKRSSKKKFSITNQNTPSHTMYSTQYDNIITEEVVEEKATPKKSTPKNTRNSSPASQRSPSPANESEYKPSPEMSRSSTLNRSSKSRTNEDTFYQPNKQTRPIDELKSEYQELVSLYNNALQIRENLKNDCSTLENELQNTYNKQSKLCRQLKKKYSSQPTTPRK